MAVFGYTLRYSDPMAIGRDRRQRVPQIEATEGYMGRLSVAPPGGLFVRNPEAARAAAIQRQIDAYRQSGQEVPEHLTQMADSLSASPNDKEIDLVDSMTGELLAEVDTEESLPNHLSPTAQSDRVAEERAAIEAQAVRTEKEPPKEPEQKPRVDPQTEPQQPPNNPQSVPDDKPAPEQRAKVEATPDLEAPGTVKEPDPTPLEKNAPETVKESEPAKETAAAEPAAKPYHPVGPNTPRKAAARRK